VVTELAVLCQHQPLVDLLRAVVGAGQGCFFEYLAHVSKNTRMEIAAQRVSGSPTSFQWARDILSEHKQHTNSTLAATHCRPAFRAFGRS
jgi:hypothetical protein